MTDGFIEIGQAIGGYAALLATMIAAIAACIIYKLRSLKMRSIELHSEQLKEIIQDWLNELKDPELPAQPGLVPKTHGYIELIPEPQPYSLCIETDILFQDLHNHLPRLLFDKWTRYKSQHDAYLRGKQQLTQCVLAFAFEATELKIHDGSVTLPETDVLLDNVIPLLLKDIDLISQEREPQWFDPRLANSATELRFENGTMFRGHHGIIYCVNESLAYNLYTQLSQALNTPQAVALAERIKELRMHFEGLKYQRENIAADLREWLKVPILPKECKLLKRGAR